MVLLTIMYPKAPDIALDRKIKQIANGTFLGDGYGESVRDLTFEYDTVAQADQSRGRLLTALVGKEGYILMSSIQEFEDFEQVDA